MEKVHIKIVTRSGQEFQTEAPKDKLCDAFRERQPDFDDTFVLEAADATKDPCFMINGKYVESITLTEIADSNINHLNNKRNYMAVTILETLMNAEINIQNAKKIPQILRLAEQQLHNGIVLLEKGYDVNTEVEPLLEQYGDVESVPDID